MWKGCIVVVGHSRLLSRLAILLAALCATLVAVPAALGATTWNVTKTADGVGTCPSPTNCTLRTAIADAAAGDTVMLPASSQHFTVTAGEIPITVAPLTIQGAGASSSVIDASAGSSRVFHVTATPASSQTITFQGVTIEGGKATVSSGCCSGGGGIMVEEVSSSIAVNLSLVNSVVTGNSATISSGAQCCTGGGGIYSNGGSITLTGSTVSHNIVTVTSNNQCCHGGGGVYDDYRASAIALSGSVVSQNSATVATPQCCNGGGGVYDDGEPDISPITISGSQLSGNGFTLNGNPTDSGNCCSGGGAVYQDAGDTTSILSSTLDGNTATINSGQCCHGGGAVYDDGHGGSISSSTLSNNTATVNGPSGANSNEHCCSGGGALITFPQIQGHGWTLTNSTLDSNSTQVTAGDCCQGGGALQFNSVAALTVLRSTISNGQATISGGTQSGGGGVYERIQSAMIGTYTNSTISGNTTNAGGVSEMGGGGIYLNNKPSYASVLANMTVAGNSAPSGYGGGIYNFGSQLDTKNSIVALNSAASKANCSNGGIGPVFTSLGYNLEDSSDTCGFTAAGDKVVPASSIGLGPLANNGGPTLTRALVGGSAAIDAGNPAGCTDPSGALLTTDQRGFKRPSNGRCDIGAFELQFGAAACKLKAKSNKVLVRKPKKKKHHKKQKVGVLALTVRCDQAASLKLGGALTETLRKHGHKGKHKKKFTLRPVSSSVGAGATVTLTLRLPKAALKALARKTKESVKLTLTATNANGVGTAVLTIGKLKPRTH